MTTALRHRGFWGTAAGPLRLRGVRGIATAARTSGGQPVNAAEAAAKSAGTSFFNWLKGNANVTVAAGLGLLVANWATPIAYNYVYTESVLQRLREGVLPPPEPHALLPREDLRRQVASLLRPERPTRFFSLILGPPGTGKSTAVRAACRDMRGGVGYLEVSPAAEDIGRDLGEAFDFRLERHITLLNVVTQTIVGRKTVEIAGGGKLATLRRSCEALHDAAAAFRAKGGATGPFVLVIDAADRLGRDKEVRDALVEYAKDWAQDGTISVVFVASRWDTAAALMGEHPAQSRAGTPLLVGDVSQEEATELLTKLGVDEKAAPRWAGLVGGSLLLLERVAGLVHASRGDDAEVHARLNDLMTLELESSGVTAEEGGGAPTVAAIRALLARGGEMAAEDWAKVVPKAEDRRKLLAGGAVLRYDGTRVKFASELARGCAAGMVGGGKK